MRGPEFAQGGGLPLCIHRSIAPGLKSDGRYRYGRLNEEDEAGIGGRLQSDLANSIFS
jgi:hypothetical protein